MKIYTRKGDEGTTSLIGGTRVPKHHLRIETYGTVDELNSWIGLLRDQLKDEEQRTFLLRIQEELFIIGSHLANDPETSTMKLPELHPELIAGLEAAMDRMEERLPEMRHFILPGGHPTVSHCHIARCVCRRSERLVVHLKEMTAVDPFILKFLNRLSDYLFVFARDIGRQLGAAEVPWIPEKGS